MISRDDDEMHRAEEAVRWLIRRESEGLAGEVEFWKWVRASPRNFDDYRAIAEFCLRLQGLELDAEIPMSEWVFRASDAGGAGAVDVVRDGGSCEEARPRAHRGRMLAGVALALVLVTVTVMNWTPRLGQRGWIFTTGVGEQRSIRLEDGSEICLNTDSEMKVFYTARERRVSLLRGEALFTVKSDVSRPFQVMTAGALVRAVGTEFDISQGAALRTTISVIAGEVLVLRSQGKAFAGDLRRSRSTPSPEPPGTFLKAGEQLRVESDGGAVSREVDISKVLQWREGRLMFDHASLAEVVAEFNRYNVRKIVVRGGELLAKPISGIFSVDHPETVLFYLRSTDPTLEVEVGVNTLVVSRR